MQCNASRIDTQGTKVVIRKGYWNGGSGFGRNKALYYHNLDMQPIIDTLYLSQTISGSPYNELYSVYHYNMQGQVDQDVTVVANNEGTNYNGTDTPDGKSVGLITGFCQSAPDEPIETECPDLGQHDTVSLAMKSSSHSGIDGTSSASHIST
jgi:hypothetical protein